jgi:hypothetical protein
MEILLIIVTCILIYIVAFKRGYEYREKEARDSISKTIDNLEKEFLDSVVVVKLEKVEDIFFVYDDKTNEFMAQGKSHEELAKTLKTRFPNKRFVASGENLREVGLPDE